ncbi:glycoside hydrolase family 2 [Chitinophaga sp. SYP-B3965]|uniref:glycosyl hydrolase n=1 Tax=Chitinophaga sp. SYP-B3965 TaxID=2663120 RepID=UPI001299B4FA|nr:glycosyl hydrolase [Chitinophaga sp. SYP-B3965]MRG44722.1 glycoside hydrolase family 2 [Chitinophaga sp. SYP-B3965]
MRYLLILFCVCSIPVFAQQTAVQKGFATPPDSTKLSMYWYWMSDNISEEGAKKDLAAMADIGVGRVFIGNIGYNEKEVPYGKVKLFSDEWWKVTRTAIRTASEKGLQIGLFNSPGWSQSGGPWIKPSQSMRYLAGEEVMVKGPQQLSQKLKGDFQDVAVLAYPAPAEDELEFIVLNTDTLSTDMHIDLDLAAENTARSLVLYMHKPFRAAVELQVKEGNDYRTITKFQVDRTNPSLNVGFKPFAPFSVSFPPVRGKTFRVTFKQHSKTGLAAIVLYKAPRIERYEEKQLAKMFQQPLPLWNEYQWPQHPTATDTTLAVVPAQIKNITQYLGKDGILRWNVPAGNWIVVRYGMLTTGVTNAPASPEGAGLEVDKINRVPIQHHYDEFIGKIYKSIPAAERTSLKWVVADSYETGSQNWTDGMEKAFKKQYGYDPLPWLPVLSGRVVGTPDQSDRFLWDLRRLIADRVAYEYVAGLRDASHKDGMRLWLENYGHWGFPSEFLKYGGQSDEVGGEFWNEGTLGNIECRAASSAAHIYGKNKVAAESFTSGGQAYVRYPALLKKRGDWSFTEGINHTLLHVFIHQPYEDRNPGVNVGFGTEFNRKNTWFYQGKAFVDYLRRCNFILQQGKPVNDIAYFIGEDAPKMTGVRDPEIPQGYSYDYINAEVILQRLSVKDGWFVLPDGMRYRLLVLPQLETMRPELLQKLYDLAKQGGAILGPAPKRSPSLQNFPKADEEVRKLAAAMWKLPNVVSGKGIIDGKNAMHIRLLPDVSLANPNVLYAHRTAKDADYYFLTNQTDQTVKISPTFRMEDKQPELWDPVTGKIRDLPEFNLKFMGTTVPLQLEAYESAFIVFRKKFIPDPLRVRRSNFPQPQVLQELSNAWQVKFNSTYTFETLTDWSKHPDEQIKNFSGTAYYTKTFSAPAIGKERYFINLGSVMVMAKVKLNGVDLGTLWTAPWKVEVTGILKNGDNKLEVEVVNTWVNGLIGDSKLPATERKYWSNVNPYTPASKYQSAGLLGPVKLESIPY